jgi:peptidoglycan/xylan/chitin deacetylase (PgdA/CDA1 family)
MLGFEVHVSCGGRRLMSFGVMYHNVGGVSDGCIAGVPSVSTAAFEEQLDVICSKADVVESDGFIGAGAASAREKVLLTFDDGLLCHYRVVAPILLRRRLAGVFFVAADVLENGEVLDVQRVQFLLAQRGMEIEQRIREHLLGAIAPWRLTDHQVDMRYPGLLRNRHDQSDVALIKKYLQVLIPASERRGIISDAIVKFFGADGGPKCDDVYMNREQVSDLAKAGFAIGGHSASHPWMAYIDKEQLAEEVGASRSLVHSFGQRNPMFCYPYGSHSRDVMDEVRRSGFECAFSVVSGRVSDYQQQRFALPRIDTVDLPPSVGWPEIVAV